MAAAKGRPQPFFFYLFFYLLSFLLF